MGTAIHGLDHDRILALSYVRGERGASLRVLWSLDVILGTLVATGTQPALTQIKLAWWRDALDRLDRHAPPSEPMLQAVARELLPLGMTGAELAEMPSGWEQLLGSGPLGRDALDTYASLRGGRLFRLSAALLGGTAASLEANGEAWALVDLARRSREADRSAAFARAAERLPMIPRYWPSSLRPLGMLAMLTRRDLRRTAEGLERPGTPIRMLRMLGHRLTGR